MLNTAVLKSVGKQVQRPAYSKPELLASTPNEGCP
jgi:hypothetical protein